MLKPSHERRKDRSTPKIKTGTQTNWHLSHTNRSNNTLSEKLDEQQQPRLHNNTAPQRSTPLSSRTFYNQPNKNRMEPSPTW